MMSVLVSLLLTLRTWARSRAALQLEVLALRHQLQVLQRSQPRRLQLAQADRWLWVVLSRVLTGWRTTLVIVKPETVIGWHRRGFRRGDPGARWSPSSVRAAHGLTAPRAAGLDPHERRVICRALRRQRQHASRLTSVNVATVATRSPGRLLCDTCNDDVRADVEICRRAERTDGARGVQIADRRPDGLSGRDSQDSSHPGTRFWRRSNSWTVRRSFGSQIPANSLCPLRSSKEPSCHT
jgi:hypothetical protein